jgi:hypothetical protein
MSIELTASTLTCAALEIVLNTMFELLRTLSLGAAGVFGSGL